MYKAKPLFTTNCTAPTVLFNKAMIKLQELDRASYRFQITTDVIWTDKVQTAATCGYYTYFNPDAYENWCKNVYQRCFVHAHEIKHMWLKHPQRQVRYAERGYFNSNTPFIMDIWARAIDIIINADNLAMGMEAPEGVIIDDRFTRNDNVDQVYVTLIKEYLDKKEQEKSFPPPPPPPPPSDTDDESDESDAGEDTPDAESGADESDDSEDDRDSDSDDSGDESEDGSGEDSDEDADDDSGESGEGGESGDDDPDGDPTPSSDVGHAEHFAPSYEGDPEEQAAAADEDEKRIERNVDDAIDAALAEDHENHNMGGGFATAGYRHTADHDPSGINWEERLADVMTRAGSGGPVNWGKINRRKFFNTGCVMPTHKGSIDRLVITDDISSSVDDDQWGLFLNSFAALADMLQPANGTLVMWTNEEVVRTDVVMSGAELMALEAPRGGGNRLRAGCEYLYENGINYDVHIAFTDGWTPREDYERWAADGVIVVLDHVPELWIMEHLVATNCEYIVMGN